MDDQTSDEPGAADDDGATGRQQSLLRSDFLGGGGVPSTPTSARRAGTTDDGCEQAGLTGGGAGSGRSRRCCPCGVCSPLAIGVAKACSAMRRALESGGQSANAANCQYFGCLLLGLCRWSEAVGKALSCCFLELNLWWGAQTVVAVAGALWWLGRRLARSFHWVFVQNAFPVMLRILQEILALALFSLLGAWIVVTHVGCAAACPQRFRLWNRQWVVLGRLCVRRYNAAFQHLKKSSWRAARLAYHTCPARTSLVTAKILRYCTGKIVRVGWRSRTTKARVLRGLVLSGIGAVFVHWWNTSGSGRPLTIGIGDAEVDDSRYWSLHDLEENLEMSRLMNTWRLAQLGFYANGTRMLPTATNSTGANSTVNDTAGVPAMSSMDFRIARLAQYLAAHREHDDAARLAANTTGVVDEARDQRRHHRRRSFRTDGGSWFSNLRLNEIERFENRLYQDHNLPWVRHGEVPLQLH